jgi:hypothetical protein
VGAGLENLSPSCRKSTPATARLVSLNRARRGAYNDIDSVNINGGLVVLQLGGGVGKLWLTGMSVLATVPTEANPDTPVSRDFHSNADRG